MTNPSSSSTQNVDLNQVIRLHANGDIKGAEAGYRAIIKSTGGVPEACSNLGIICKASGRLEEAVKLWEQAIALNPDYSDALLNLGNALKDQGKLEEAAANYRKALALKPDLVGAHNNLGLILKEQGRLDEAIASYQKALTFKPDLAEAHSNLGLALQKQGKLEEAIQSYQNAIDLMPTSAGMHYNLGNVLRDSGKLEQAFVSYRKAIGLNPHFADAHNNLGFALERYGKINEAISSYQRALAITPNDEKVLANFARATNRCKVINATDDTVKLIIRCLENLRIATTEGNATGHAILLQGLNNTIEGDAPIDVMALDSQTADLLIASLKHSLITNPKLEDVLIRARSDFLREAKERDFSVPNQARRLELLRALAHQSFLNEYVWQITDEENQTIRELEQRIIATINVRDIPTDSDLFLLASYRPLHQNEVIRDWCLQALPNLEQESAASLSYLVLNPVTEAGLAVDIEQLTTIDDATSLSVKSQYEDNPYPRWDSLSIGRTRAYIKHILREIFPHQPKLKATTDTPYILIAGCGTGVHPISTALRCSNSKVLATDLSRTSLAYAKRKAKEMEVTNVRFALADILKLNELDEQFDVIESSGVLHHMADPKAGLGVLVNLLKPGGFIKLALYSEKARQPVVRLRKSIAEQGLRPDLEGIRSIRQFIREHEQDYWRILKSADFYNTSGVRDMLFHVQEHRFTLPQISDLLSSLNLEFLGFLITNPSITALYVSQFPDDPDCLNLRNWHAFEQQNPLLFGKMYTFWCRKAG